MKRIPRGVVVGFASMNSVRFAAIISRSRFSVTSASAFGNSSCTVLPSPNSRDRPNCSSVARLANT